jgi:polyhydroxybutyrate depolymerase
MRFLRWTLVLILLLGALLAAAYYYYFYVPRAAPPPLAGSYSQGRLMTAAGVREFYWYQPRELPRDAALVVVLHGSGSSGAQVRASAGYEFDIEADRHGLLVAYPDGYQQHWNDCRKDADYAANRENIDDVGFLRQMIQWFVSERGVDPRRVFVSGHANGGHMAFRLALEAPELVRGIAPISANLPSPESMGCFQSGEPVSVAIFNGTADPINPYEGGLVEVLGNTSRGVVLSALETAEYWNRLAGISGSAEVTHYPELDGRPETSVVMNRWRSDDGVQVRLYTLQGSGHGVPARHVRLPRFLGTVAADISGAGEIVDFFTSVEQLD